MRPRDSIRGSVRPSIGLFDHWSVHEHESKSGKTSILDAFWAAAPKGRCPVEHRGEFPDVRPSVRPSVPPPVDHQGLKLALPGLNLALQASNQPSRLQISPSPMPQICPPDLKSALQTFNQPFKHQISPPCLKFALQTSNLLSQPKICPTALKYAFSGLNQSSKA